MSIRDVMDTSWEDLMGVLGSLETSEKEEVVDLVDFLETLRVSTLQIKGLGI